MADSAPITWRRVRTDDFPLLAGWLAQPHVARWWHHETTASAVERDFGPATRGEEPSEDLLAHVDGRPFGLVQRCRLDDYPQYRAELSAVVDVAPETLTIDYLIGAAADTGRSLGTRMITAIVADTWHTHPRAAAIVVPVVAANRASWRALEKAGAQYLGTGDLPPDNPADPPAHHIYRFTR